MPHSPLNLTLPEHPTLLCVGAHCDDIEIGCSGTMLRLMALYPGIRITWLVLTGNADRHAETRSSAERLSDGRIELVLHQFRDGYLPHDGESVKDAFEAIKSTVDPDLILCHWEGDRHQDHRFVSELVCNTFRRHLILEYEIPKYDGDLGRPNVYVPLSTGIIDRKIENLMESYSSQSGKHWFDAETFKALHRLRGIENGSQERYAEAFHGRKLVLLD